MTLTRVAEVCPLTNTRGLHLTCFLHSRVFRHFDEDFSGTIDRDELAKALSRFGYRLSPQLLDMLQSKFETLPEEGMSRARVTPGITFDRCATSPDGLLYPRLTLLQVCTSMRCSQNIIGYVQTVSACRHSLGNQLR